MTLQQLYDQIVEMQKRPVYAPYWHCFQWMRGMLCMLDGADIKRPEGDNIVWEHFDE